MEVFVTVAQVVAPIFAAIILGILAKKKNWVTVENVQGFQSFVMKIGLPCALFNSCLTAQIGAESLSSMALVLPTVLLGTLWAFRYGRKKFPYHNLPQLFCAQESGMLGIPLFIILFGADQAYRMGILDLTQSVVAIPVIAILSSDAGNNPTPTQVVKKVLSSPLMIMSLLGLALNFSGAGNWLDNLGVLGIVTETTGFLSQPISALMLFSVGFNFSLAKGSCRDVFRISALHFSAFALACLLIQGLLFLIPGVDTLTRMAIFLYCMLPGSYLAPSLGRSEADYQVAAGVCSVLTLVCLAIVCVMAAVIV